MPAPLIVQFLQYGWLGVALFLVLCFRRETKMLAMRLVFAAYGYPKEKRDRWLEEETGRRGAHDLAVEYLGLRRRRGKRIQPSGDRRDRSVRALPSSSPKDGIEERPAA